MWWSSEYYNWSFRFATERSGCLFVHHWSNCLWWFYFVLTSWSEHNYMYLSLQLVSTMKVGSTSHWLLTQSTKLLQWMSPSSLILMKHYMKWIKTSLWVFLPKYHECYWNQTVLMLRFLKLMVKVSCIWSCPRYFKLMLTSNNYFVVGFLLPKVIIREQDSIGAVNITVGLISGKLCGQMKVDFSIDNTSSATGKHI